MSNKKAQLLAYSFVLSLIGIILVIGIFWFVLHVELVGSQQGKIEGVKWLVRTDNLIADWSSANIDLFYRDIDIEDSFRNFAIEKGYKVPEELSLLNCQSNILHDVFYDSYARCTFYVGDVMSGENVEINRLVYFPANGGFEHIEFHYWVRL